MFFLCFLQLWLVLHLYTGICLLVPHLPSRLHHKAYCESYENLCQTLCCSHGITWFNQRIFGLSQLSSSNHVQIHQGTFRTPQIFTNSFELTLASVQRVIKMTVQVLPVMIMGAFIPGLRRKYPVHEYISAFLLVLGLILFTLADAQMSPNFSMIGILMISGALIMDAFLGNLQEAIFTMNPETTQARKHNKKKLGSSCFVLHLRFL